jgi:hypothetical protein
MEEILRSVRGGPLRRGAFTRASRFLGRFRFVFMPAGLFALIAVGVHAAADTLDDRILWLVDRVDAAFDAVVGGWGPTSAWVHWIDLSDRVRIARGFALVWELAADLVLAVPAIGYREQERGRPARGFTALLGTPARRWAEMWRDVVRRPTVLRVTRPLATAAVALAGSCAVARMVQGALYLSLRVGIGDSLAGALARIAALCVLCAVLLAFGARAVLRNLQHADTIATREPGVPWLRVFAKGSVGSAIVVPLAVAALLGASPVLSFFR